jgi:OOP family OmpA-OmpF porin
MRSLGRIRRSASIFTVFLAGLVLSAGASAGQFYLGGSVGNVNVDLGAPSSTDVSDILLSDLGFSGTVTVTSDNLDDSDVGFKIFAGYAFDQYWAIEAKYADFGTVSENAVANINVTDGIDTLVGTLTLGADLDLSGYGIDVLGSYPVSDAFSVFAKVGYFFHKVDANLNLGFTGTDNGVAATFSDSVADDDDGSDFSYGLGADYRFQNMALRLEWERYNVSAFDSDLDTDVISASFIYKF